MSNFELAFNKKKMEIIKEVTGRCRTVAIEEGGKLPLCTPELYCIDCKEEIDSTMEKILKEEGIYIKSRQLVYAV